MLAEASAGQQTQREGAGVCVLRVCVCRWRVGVVLACECLRLY